jgi:Transposase DDE domain
VIFQHPSIESPRRELLRNGELRQLCGFDPLLGLKAVPPPYVYTRLFVKLFAHQAELDAMFDGLVERLKGLLPDLGVHMAVDSKAVDSHGHPTKAEDPDGRRDQDADWGTKTYSGVREDGSTWEKVKHWFGYKIHLIVDAVYELPLGYIVTKASANDAPYLMPLIEALDPKHPELLERAQDVPADKAYDAEPIVRNLYDLYTIKPIIDTRACWKDEPELPRPLYPERVDTLFYTESGGVVCRRRDEKPEEKDNYTPMVYEGFEADRKCLKYRCPAAVKGWPCSQRDLCHGGAHTEHGRIVRIPLDTDRRTFVPLPRHTPSWQKAYDRRTAVERVNSRLDVSFGFERHFVRGLKKMTCRVTLALVLMLALAVGWIEAGQPERMRSLVGRRAA